jgi:hypothetical protein
MQLLLDGGGTLLEYGKSLLFLIGTVLGFGSLGVSLLPGLTRDRRWISFPLSLGTGAILVMLLSYVLFLVSLLWRDVVEFGAYAILLAGVVLLVWGFRRREAWISAGWGLLALPLLLLVRLAFVSNLVLPPYSDSPTHYLVVLNLLEPSARPDALYSFQQIFQHYYHFGVHCLTAWVALVSAERSPLLLPVIGQVFLTILPFSVFALAGILAENAPPVARKSAAWAAGLIAAFGWWMPAYGANWGKYPTIAALAVVPVPLAYLYATKGTRPGLSYFLFSGVLCAGAALLHSRTVLLMGLAVTAYFLASRAGRQLLTLPWLLVAAVLVLTGGVTYWGWLRPDLAGFYTSNWPLLVALAVLLPSACMAYPAETLCTLLALDGMVWLTSLQAPAFLANHTIQLLDRPFVQLGLYLPLAVLGGLGAAGLSMQLSGARKLSGLPVLLLSLLILIQTSSIHPLYPDRCCSYATQNDLRAFEWLKQNVSSKGLIVIAGLRTSTRILETDAGMWVYAMTGLDTTKRSFNSTLNDPEFLHSVCQVGDEVYLYVGGRPMSFKPSKMSEESGDFRVVFSSGKTGIVQVRACLR